MCCLIVPVLGFRLEQKRFELPDKAAGWWLGMLGGAGHTHIGGRGSSSHKSSCITVHVNFLSSLPHPELFSSKTCLSFYKSKHGPVSAISNV